jgi:hypothetical protein
MENVKEEIYIVGKSDYEKYDYERYHYEKYYYERYGEFSDIVAVS